MDARVFLRPRRRLATAWPSPAMMPTTSGAWGERLTFGASARGSAAAAEDRTLCSWGRDTGTVSACGATWPSFVLSQARWRNVSAPHTRQVCSRSRSCEARAAWSRIVQQASTNATQLVSSWRSRRRPRPPCVRPSNRGRGTRHPTPEALPSSRPRPAANARVWSRDHPASRRAVSRMSGSLAWRRDISRSASASARSASAVTLRVSASDTGVGAYAFRSQAAANLKCGCLLTGSQPVSVSSLAAPCRLASSQVP